MILQSVFILLLLAVLPGWNMARGRDAPAYDHLYRLVRRLVAVCLLVAFFSGFLWIWLAIASMSGSSLSDSLQPNLFWMVLTQTQPGRVWLLRAGVALVLATALLFVFGRRRGSKASSLAIPLCALLAMALTASLAWLGHAGAGEGPNQNLHLAGDLLHLVAAGIWPAGLAPFAIFLSRFLRARDPSLLLAACVATRRLSALSLLTVGVLFASGLANTYFLVGTFHALVSTDYGLLLLLKIVLACAAVSIGAWNLLILKSRLAESGGLPPGETQSAALAKVARNVLIELCLASLILFVVGLLGITPPASHS